ncbi:MAG: hypothetical protein JEZ04_17155 [Spirochaetales bacterium]|nr:hypothetical protein [Spirochaetales bacterium]
MTFEVLWKVHGILMSSSFTAMLCGIIISLFFKKNKWRYRIHRKLGIYAGISGAASLLVAAIMVQIFTGAHFTSAHTLAGGLTGIFLILTPIFGLTIRTVKNKALMKLLHRIAGFLTAALMLLTILLGLSLSGILSLQF